MATVQDTLRTVVELDGAENYIAGLRGISRQSESAAEQQRKLIEMNKRLSTAMAGIAVAGAGAIAYLAKQADAYDQYRNKLEIATKSTTKAAEIFAWAQNYANRTPFETSAVVDSAARLEAYGMTAQKWLPLAGDMAGAMSRDITQAVEAIADAISGGGLERLKEFGVTSQQLKQRGWTGSYQDVQGIESLKKALSDLMSDRFMGGTERMSGTLSGKLSTLRGEASNLAATLGSDLVPELGNTVDGMTSIVRLLGSASPTTRQFVLEGLKVVTVGTAIAAITLRIKAMRMEYLANTLAVKAATTAQQQEVAAVREGVVAYNEKSYAMAKAASASGAQSAAALGAATAGGARGPWIARGGLKGGLGVGQQIVGMTLGLNAASKIDMGGEWDATSTNVQNLGRVAGYAAGMFNPLILATTLLADAISWVVDTISDNRADAMAKRTENAWGFGPGNTVQSEGQIRREYRDIYGEGGNPNITEDEYVRRTMERQRDEIPRIRARIARQQLEEQRKNEVKQAQSRAESLKTDQQAYSGVTQMAQVRYERSMRSDSPEGLLANRGQVELRASLLAAAIRNEARAYDEMSKNASRAGEMSDDMTKRSKAFAESIQARAQAMRLEAQADQVLEDTKNKLAQAQQRVAEEARREAEAQKQAMLAAQNARVSNAQASASYTEALFGKNSQQAVSAHESLGKLLNTEALQAAQMGDLARSYNYATQSLKELQYAQEALMRSMEESLGIGSAYAEYLRAIGDTKGAAAFERSFMARQSAEEAKMLFSGGDLAGGFKAAAAAEKYARSVVDKKGSGTIAGLESSRFPNRALTDAVRPDILRAASNQPIMRMGDIRMHIEDDFVNADKLHISMDRKNFFKIHAQ